MADMTMGGMAPAGVAGDTGTRRWLPALPGLAFVVLFVVGVMIPGNSPSDGDSDSTWTNWYADKGHRITLLLSGFLVVIAAMALMVFLTRLHARVHAGRTGDPLPLVATAAAAAAMATGAVVYASIPGGMIFGSLPLPNAELLRVTADIGFPIILVGTGFSMAVAIGWLTRAGQRSGYFGRAMSIFGYVAAAAGVASFMFIPLAVIMLWAITVSIVMARRPVAVPA